MRLPTLVAASLLVSVLATNPAQSQDTPPGNAETAASPHARSLATPPQPPADPVAAAVAAAPGEPAAADTLARENALLLEKVKSLESRSISCDELAARNLKRLKEIAANVRAQRQGVAEFEGYVKWMSSHVAGYDKYFAAGSMAARVAKVLPIPYAGQASLLTKFVSDAAASLGGTSACLNNYLATSQQFLARVDALDQNQGAGMQELSSLARFADRDLLKGMLDVQERLATTSQVATSSLSFLESVNHYVGATDEYWAKTKSFLKSDDKVEKSFLSESTAALRNKVQTFNGKLVLFDATVKKAEPQIKALVAYDDLILELAPKAAGIN